MRSRADAAPAWLRVAELAPRGSRVAFESEDQHYLKRVCRARPGDQVHLTDGRGTVAVARLALDHDQLVAEIETTQLRARTRSATLLCGAPESGRADWLIEKLGELGVALFQPVNCERDAWSKADARIDRWRRLAIAALRQSQRPYLLEVRAPRDLALAVAELPANASLWLADPAGAAAEGERAGREDAVGLVGPAGGFSDAERSLILARGARPISLSDGRLRTETAALSWSAWWSASAPAAGSGVRAD